MKFFLMAVSHQLSVSSKRWLGQVKNLSNRLPFHPKHLSGYLGTDAAISE